MGKRTVHQDQQGFTLLETSIALLLMMTIFVGVASLFLYAVRYNSAAAIRAGALAAAQRKLEQLRSSPFAACASSSEVITVSDPTTGALTYSVATTVVDTSSSSKDITIVVTPQGRSTTGG